MISFIAVSTAIAATPDEFRMILTHRTGILTPFSASTTADVRQKLLIIAEDFVEHLGISDLDVADITISGSNAAYTYTAHSDIDLHILVDMQGFEDDDVYRELFDAKKTVYNDQHDIMINGYEVELYVQDSNLPVISLGEYSVLNDRWIKLPRKRKADLDQMATKLKFRKIYKLANYALHSKTPDKIQNVLRTLKKYRQAGLDNVGEFSPENLAFKALRSKGIIKKLYDKLLNTIDKKLLENFRMKQEVTKIPTEYFDVIKEGMHDVTVFGTAAFIKVPGHEFCAKTGTAQNPHGKNHSLFVCFAPKDNPKIAVAVIVENAGFGSTWAGPIAGLIMEKYLNDTLTKESKTKVDYLSNVDLMPESIKAWYIRNNKTEMLTPIEYNNDELADVWDMEMISENTPIKAKVDTIKKIDTVTPPAKPVAPPIKNKKTKEQGLNPTMKKKKANSKINNVSI